MSAASAGTGRIPVRTVRIRNLASFSTPGFTLFGGQLLPSFLPPIYAIAPAIKTIIDAIAFAIQAMVDPVPAPVETMFDAVAPAIQA